MTRGPYISMQAAAAYVGRSEKWLRRRLPLIAHIKDGGLLFTQGDLDAYLSTRRVEPRKTAIPADTPGGQVLDLLMGPRSRRASETQAAARKPARGAASDMTTDHTRGRR